MHVELFNILLVCIVFHCVDIPHSSIDGYFTCFLILAISLNADMSTGGHISSKINVFIWNVNVKFLYFMITKKWTMTFDPLLSKLANNWCHFQKLFVIISFTNRYISKRIKILTRFHYWMCKYRFVHDSFSMENTSDFRLLICGKNEITKKFKIITSSERPRPWYFRNSLS